MMPSSEKTQLAQSPVLTLLHYIVIDIIIIKLDANYSSHELYKVPVYKQAN